MEVRHPGSVPDFITVWLYGALGTVRTRGSLVHSTMIRLLASDVDGTLFNSDRRVSDQNKQALRRAQDAGIVVCLASGRLIPTLRPAMVAAGVEGPMITCNGAYAEAEDGTVLVNELLNKKAQRFILEYSQKHHVNANVYQPRRVLGTHESEMMELYRTRTMASPTLMGWDALHGEPATKMIFVDHPSKNLEHKEHFTPFQAEYGFDLTVSEPEYLEFLPTGVNKGTALAKLAAHLRFAQYEVAAIGDYHNDREMLEWAGLSATPTSGAPELKEIADVVVASNDDHGVAEFVEYILERNSHQ